MGTLIFAHLRQSDKRRSVQISVPSTWDGNEIKAWTEGVNAQSPAELLSHSSTPVTPQQRNSLDNKLVKKSKTLQYMQDGQRLSS